MPLSQSCFVHVFKGLSDTTLGNRKGGGGAKRIARFGGGGGGNVL